MPTILHAVAGYFVLMLIVRVLSRRAGSQMTQFEFVIVFLMGGIIILSTVGNDRSVTNCTCAVIAVGLIHRLIASAKLRWPQFGRIVDGTPLVLVRDGQWQEEVARGMRMRHEDLEAAARSANVTRVEDVDYAVIERNGRISVFPKEDDNG